MVEAESGAHSGSLARRWFTVCLVCWLALIPISASLSVKDGAWWAAIANPINALTSAFGAVVLGAVLFKRWQDRVTAENLEREQIAWLRRNIRYVVETQDVLCCELARVAVAAYQVLRPVLGDNAVPAHLLRADLQRQPKPPGKIATDSSEFLRSVADEFEKVIHALSTGPAATAIQQVMELRRAWTALLLVEHGHTSSATALSSHRLPTDWKVKPDLSRGAFEKTLEELTPEAVDRMQTSTQRLLMLAPDVLSVRDVEPHEIRRPIQRLAAGVWALDELAECPDGPATPGRVVEEIGEVITSAFTTHEALWRIATETAKKAANAPSDVTVFAQRQFEDLADRINKRADGTSPPSILGGRYDHEWSRWREEHVNDQ